MKNEKLINCHDCQEPVSISAKTCPHCGSKNIAGPSFGFGCFGIICVLFSLGCFSDGQILLGLGATLVAIFLFFSAWDTKTNSSTKTSDKSTKTDKSIKTDKPTITDKLIFFTYSDAEGNYTERTVDFERVYMKNGHQYFDAFCRERESGRTFRVDRIIGEVYVPHEAGLYPPEEYFSRFDIKDDPVGNRMQDWDSQRSAQQTASFTSPTLKGHNMASSKGRTIALSGFEFPFFPYTEDTFVRIKDRTRYKSDFLHSYNRDTYSEEDFEEDLAPYMLDIEVQEFLTSLKQKHLKKLGIKNPPKGWDILHNDIAFRDDDEGEVFWPATKTIHKQFVQSGLLTELPDIKKNREIVFQYNTAKNLKEICRKHGLKLSGNKGELIARILDHGKTKVPRLVTPSKKYFSMLEKIAEKYIESIKEQLKDKSDAYHQEVWEQVAEDCCIGGQLPEKARSTVNDLHERHSLL